MKTNNTFYSISLCVLFLLLLMFPDTLRLGAAEGLSLWYHSVVPILFPFLILSGLMTSYDSFFWFLKPFFLLGDIIPAFNPWYFYALFLGFFCGYPMGAKAVSDLIKTKRIRKQEGAVLLPLVNQANPMFLTGYLGIHILEERFSTVRILLYVYGIPSLFFLITLFFRFKTKAVSAQKPSSIKNKNSMPQSLEHTILHSCSIIVTIGVYMMLFTVLTKLGHRLCPDAQIPSVLLCFLEFSSGLNSLKSLDFLPGNVKTALLFALTSFGGFCTAAQTSDIIKETGIPLKSYLIKKLFYAFLVFTLVYSSVSS